MALCAAGLLTGCRNLSQSETTPVVVDPAQQAQLDAQRIAVGERLLKALKDQNRDVFVADMTPDQQEKFSAEMFPRFAAELQKKLGTITNTEYLTELSQPPFTTAVWKVTFQPDPDEGSDHVKAPQQRLLMLATGELDGAVKIFALAL